MMKNFREFIEKQILESLVSEDRIILTLKKLGFTLVSTDDLGFRHLTWENSQSRDWKKIDIEIGKEKAIIEISGIDPSAPNSYYMTKFSLAKMLGKSISKFWLEFFENLISEGRIEAENFPPELQKKIIDRRGVRTGKKTGILEIKNEDKREHTMEFFRSLGFDGKFTNSSPALGIWEIRCSAPPIVLTFNWMGELSFSVSGREFRKTLEAFKYGEIHKKSVILFFSKLPENIQDAYPVALKQEIYELRGLKTGKTTGILESKNKEKIDFMDHMEKILEELGFSIEKNSLVKRDVQRASDRFGRKNDLFFLINWNCLQLRRRNMEVFEIPKHLFKVADAKKMIVMQLANALEKKVHWNPHYIDPKQVYIEELPKKAQKAIYDVRGEISSKNTGIT